MHCVTYCFNEPGSSSTSTLLDGRLSRRVSGLYISCMNEFSYHLRTPPPATNLYTPKALKRCGIPIPKAGYVTSNDVDRGKPHPDPYLAGAKKVNIDPTKCACTGMSSPLSCDLMKNLQLTGVVIEDAPSGIKAGHAAGAKTIAVCTSHSRQKILHSGTNPDYVVNDLTKWVLVVAGVFVSC